MNYALSDPLISLIRLLLMSNDEWEKTREKGKPPKAKLEPSVIEYGERILKKRLDKYNTNIQVCSLHVQAYNVLNRFRQ
jgi:SET domain-containing protein 6